MIYKDDVTQCELCWKYHLTHPELEFACASVGVSRGLSTQEVLAAYLHDFHRKGHK